MTFIVGCVAVTRKDFYFLFFIFIFTGCGDDGYGYYILGEAHHVFIYGGY
jgi:hypothetical protein